MPLFMLEKKLVLFIHVPKAGGSSIEHFLAPHYVGLMDTSYPGGLPCSPQHFHAALLSIVLKNSPIDYKFMVVRHPLRRLESEYKFRKKHFGDVKNMDFEAWVAHALETYLKNPYHLDNHLRPMTEFILPNTQVYKLEDGLERLRDDLHSRYPTAIAKEKAIPHAHETGTEERCGIASKEVTDLVYGFYKEDFERWYPDDHKLPAL